MKRSENTGSDLGSTIELNNNGHSPSRQSRQEIIELIIIHSITTNFVGMPLGE